MTASPLPPPDATFTRLRREHLGTDPLVTFADWLTHAEAHSVLRYPNACTLSTVSAEGMPEGRIVLLKGVDARGLIFYTNYRSAKARSLAVNARAALTFYWDALGRQVRAAGTVERVEPEESDAYFATRPRLSRLGAWASDQSRPLDSREELESRLDEMRTRFGEGDVSRPPHWGGFVLRPTRIEFWAAGDARLHDRFLFTRVESESGDEIGPWSVVRLNP